MAIEKSWDKVPARSFSADGTADGVVTLPFTLDFKVKQKVILRANTVQYKALEIKRILSPTQLVVGRRNQPLDDKEDVSAFTVALSATIEADEQPRPAIPEKEFWRAMFMEEPTVAMRSHLVDYYGRSYSPNNPVPVQLSDGSINIGTVNAELEVQLSHKDNDPDAGDVHDSVRIGDGVEEMEVNPDGSTNVNIVPSNTAAKVESTYAEATSVPTSTPTLLDTFVAPVGKLSFLHKIVVSGTNVATYTVKLNGSVIDRARTYFGASLNHVFDFSDLTKGKLLTVGDTVTVEVEHARPFVGDFNSRIQSIQV